jgi:cyclic pyranopterin phosphate synthase
MKLASIKKIRLILTDFCNYKCKFCHNEGCQTKNTSFLSRKNIIIVTRVAKKLNINKITLTGGEPLLHGDISHIVREIKDNYPRISLGMSTNGMLFNERNLKEIIPSISRLRLNFQSLDENVCKVLCGSTASNNKINWVIGSIRKINPSINICLNFVLTAYNKKSLLDVAKYAISHNLDLKILEYGPINKNLYIDIDFATRILSQLLPIKKEHAYQGNDIYFFRNSKSRIRVCYSFCNLMKCNYCRKCGEVRLTPDLTLKHCFKDTIKEIKIAKELAKGNYKLIQKKIVEIDKIKGKLLVGERV